MAQGFARVLPLPLAVAQGGTGATTSTGTGAVVLATSPSLVTPALGNASATSLTFTTNGNGISDFNGVSALTFLAGTTPVNYFTVTNSGTGSKLKFESAGTDTNIIMQVNGKGTGNVEIKGTGTNNNAAAGYVGELIENTATGVALTTVTAVNITSISLTVGDWNVWGNVAFAPAGSTTVSVIVSTINTTSATLPSTTAGNGAYTQISYPTAVTGGQHAIPAGMFRLSLAATTTVYLIGYCAFGTSTCTASGYIGARRLR